VRALLLTISLWLLAGCPELVAVDDPRTIGGDMHDGGIQEDGTCEGSPVFCEDRSQAQCNSGCVLAPACRSPKFERCAEMRDENACDADLECHWIADSCAVDDVATCESYKSQSACELSSSNCGWGQACTDSAAGRVYCFEIKTAVACAANLGCRWVAD